MTAAGGSGAGEGSPAMGAVVRAFVRSRVAGNLLMLLALAGGLLVATGIEVELLPAIDTRVVRVTVPFPGASPGEVEESVTRRLEERLIGLPGVGQVTSTAAAGLGSVHVFLKAFANTAEVLDEVRTAVARIERFPPPGAEQPEVGTTFVHTPAVTLAVASPELSPDALRLAAERVREDMLKLPSVTNVTLDYAAAREIVIEVDEEALREHGLTIGEVAETLGGSSVEATSGQLLTSAGGLVMRVNDRRLTAAEFEDLVLLGTPGGALVTVADVADVREGFGDAAGDSELDGVPTVFVKALATVDGESEVQIARAVLAMFAEYTPPPGAEVSVWEDSSRQATSRLNAVLSTGALGLVLVFVLLALVFDFRLAMWVAVGLPVSFLGAIVLFPAFDLTFNFVTIYGLIMMIGIVVDDAVVVGESVATERERGLAGPEAAVVGARRVFWPVAVGVATTFLAFAPLLFTYGQVGQVLKALPIVAGLVLAVSLIEAFLILPSHLSHGGNWSRWPLAGVQARVRGAIDRMRDQWTVPAVAAATRRPAATLVTAILVVVAAVALFSTGVVRFGAIEQFPTGRVEAQLTYPVGTPLDTTRVGARQIEAAARLTNEQLGAPIDGIATVVGHHAEPGSVPDSGGRATHVASVSLRLRDESKRSVSSTEVIRAWRRNVGEVVGAERLVYSVGNANAAVADFRIALVHPDAEALALVAEELIAAIEASPGVLDAYDSLVPGRRNLDLELTPAAQAVGLTAADIATQLRGRFFGAEVQRIQRGRDEVKVMVRYPEDRRGSFDELANERIETPMGGDIPVAVALRVVETQDWETLSRIDGLPSVEIGSSLDTRAITARELQAHVEEWLPELQSRHPGLDIAWSVAGAEDDEQTTGPLAYTLPVALLVMYMLMAVQFRSYAQPLVILTAMPLATAGAVLAHFILGYDVTMASVFGLVAVLGVVINDTLLLMDRSNSLRAKSSLPAIAAIAGAVRERFRPILLTTLTTVVGLLPVLYMRSEAMANYAPLVVSIVGGLVAGSAGILFVVPAMLLLGEGARERFAAMRAAAPQTAP